MFDPDGRNSIQTVGHWVWQLFSYACMALAFAALVPVYLTVRGWQTMKRQEAGIRAVNHDSRIQTLQVDLNKPVFFMEDAADYQDFKEHASPEDEFDPSLRSLPFSVSGANTGWVYYNLPFDANVVNDRFFGRGALEAEVTQPMNLPAIDSLSGVVERYDTSFGAISLRDDPWVSQGLFKMAPTKWWDWYTVLQLTQAKAAGNYAAYATATRVTARMRALAAGCNTFGNKFIDADWSVPARIAAAVPEPQRLDFMIRYTRAFNDLPVFEIQVQPLDKQTLLQDPEFKEWEARVGERGWSDAEEIHASVQGVYITGIRMAGSTEWGRPTFTRTDYLFRGKPYLDDETHAAQAALQAMLTPEFWAPRFQKLGMGDPLTLDQIEHILTTERQRLTRDVQFARVHGHKAFRHNELFSL